MDRWLPKANGLVLALGLGSAVCAPGVASAQAVFERETTITGPRGNSVTRDLKSIRGPGLVERSTSITRSTGASLNRSVIMQRPGFGGGGFAPPPMHRGGGWGWRPGPVIINQGGGASALGAGLIGAAVGTAGGLLLGKALSSPPPPPPVYAVPVAPAYVVPAQPVAPAANVAVAPPVVSGPDPVATEIVRLSSRHESSRKDAIGNLGRMHDPRAIPALVERLKNDHSKDVRVAAATALGEIGDPSAQIILERAVVYDKKQEVRDAASAALARMPRPASAPVASNPAPSLAGDSAASSNVPRLDPIERVPPAPVPAPPPQ